MKQSVNGGCISAALYRDYKNAKANAKSEVLVQSTLSRGGWGKPQSYKVFGGETPEQVVERLNKLNPGKTFRIAE